MRTDCTPVTAEIMELAMHLLCPAKKTGQNYTAGELDPQFNYIHQDDRNP